MFKAENYEGFVLYAPTQSSYMDGIKVYYCKDGQFKGVTPGSSNRWFWPSIRADVATVPLPAEFILPLMGEEVYLACIEFDNKELGGKAL